jgi:hypothetical protein
MRKIWISAVAFIILAGCVMVPQEETANNVNHEKVNYREYHEDKEQEPGEYENDYGRYLMREELSANEMDSYTDPTTTERSQEIAEALMKNRDIVMAEVHELDDRIFVAVRLRENNFDRSHQNDIIPFIEEKVREFLGSDQKQLEIWTDHIEWNEFKNDGAELENLLR